MSFFSKTFLFSFFLLHVLPGTSQNVRPEPPSVIVIAHRGNHVNVPENTLASCREAIRCGADYVEVDVRSTKDGKLVLLHDATVDRTTNGHGALSAMTWKQVQALQLVGKSGKKYRIPTFEQVLKLCRGKIKIYLDFKEAEVGQTWKLIQQAHMEEEVIVYLNQEEQYAAWKRIAPKVPLMTSLPDHYRGTSGLNAFLDQVNVQVLDNLETPALIEAAQKRGVAVWLDVQSPQEGPASWDAALHKGVNGLQTDHPEDLIRYLKSKKMH